MKNFSKIFWGLFFIVGAIFIIINQLGYYSNLKLLPLVLTIFIVAIFIKSIIHINFFGILFSIATIIIIYNNELGLESITPWPVLITALLGSIGLSIIFGSHKFINYNTDEHFDKVVNDKDNDVIEFQVSFGSAIKYVNSEDFKSANLKSSFGALKVYFDNSKIKDEEATINLDVSFSGVELYLPKEWKIINKVNSSLGSLEEKNRHSNTTNKTIILTGNVHLGGVEIIYI